jgi:hypothetical protein
MNKSKTVNNSVNVKASQVKPTKTPISTAWKDRISP